MGVKAKTQKLAEEQLHGFADEEIAANSIRPGVWAKAVAESDGDEAKAKASYIKLRVEAMKAKAVFTSILHHSLPLSPIAQMIHRSKAL